MSSITPAQAGSAQTVVNSGVTGKAKKIGGGIGLPVSLIILGGGLAALAAIVVPAVTGKFDYAHLFGNTPGVVTLGNHSFTSGQVILAATAGFGLTMGIAGTVASSVLLHKGNKEAEEKAEAEKTVRDYTLQETTRELSIVSSRAEKSFVRLDALVKQQEQIIGDNTSYIRNLQDAMNKADLCLNLDNNTFAHRVRAPAATSLIVASNP